MKKAITKIHKQFIGTYEEAMKLFDKQPEGTNMTCLGETYEFFKSNPTVKTNWIIWTKEA